MWEILQSTIYLLGNAYVGSGKCGNVKMCGQCADETDRQVMVDDDN